MVNTNFGYARCSTNESRQDIDRQVRELKAAGAEKVYLEYEHGDSAVKQVQQRMFELAQEGDTIITLEVSRLARSTKQLCEIIDLIKGKSLCLIIVGSSVKVSTGSAQIKKSVRKQPCQPRSFQGKGQNGRIYQAELSTVSP